MNILIKNIILENKPVDIGISGDLIESIKDHEGLTAVPEGCKILDGKGNIVLPMLHNGHTHSPMVLLRGFGDDMALDDWLHTRIWPAESRFREEDFYWGNRLALIEMIKNGTGFFNEMYMNPDSLMKVLQDYPVKALVSYPIIDGMDEEYARSQIEAAERFFKKWEWSTRVKRGIALHSVYANSPFSLKWAGEYGRTNNVPLHIHLCETEKEVLDCRERNNGLSPVEYLESLDFFRQNRVYAAHSIYLSAKDMKIMAGHDVVAVHNPVSNMKLASGKAFPYEEIKSYEIPIVLGTDGAASNNNLDLLEEMKIAALLQKHEYKNPKRMSARQAYELSSGPVAAQLFGTGSGLIEPGAQADLMIVNKVSPSFTPITDLYSNMVYSASGRDIQHLIIGGEILMENRVVDGEVEAMQKAAECAGWLTGKDGND